MIAITLLTLTLPLIAEPQPGSSSAVDTRAAACTRRGFPCKVTTGVGTVHGLNDTRTPPRAVASGFVNDEPASPLNGSLFVAVACYDEDAFLLAWDAAMLPASRALARGVADLRFFTSNAAFGTNRTRRARELAPIIYLDDPTISQEGKNRTAHPYFWRDFVLWMFRWALRHSNFEYLVRSELDALLCVDTIYRALPSGVWTLGLARKCGYDDTFLLASRRVIASLGRNWKPFLRRISLIESGGDPEDPEHKSGWPMLGPLLPRLITLLTERDPALKNSTVHVVSSEWPRPTQDDEAAPWWKAVRHHPGKRHWDGPEHDWKDARNRRDQEHYLGTKDAPDDAICRGHFYLHKIKDVDGIRSGWGLVLEARRDEKRLGYGPPLPSEPRPEALLPNFWPAFWERAEEVELHCSLQHQPPTRRHLGGLFLGRGAR